MRMPATLGPASAARYTNCASTTGLALVLKIPLGPSAMSMPPQEMANTRA